MQADEQARDAARVARTTEADVVRARREELRRKSVNATRERVRVALQQLPTMGAHHIMLVHSGIGPNLAPHRKNSTQVYEGEPAHCRVPKEDKNRIIARFIVDADIVEAIADPLAPDDHRVAIPITFKDWKQLGSLFMAKMARLEARLLDPNADNDGEGVAPHVEFIENGYDSDVGVRELEQTMNKSIAEIEADLVEAYVARHRLLL